MSVSNLHEHHVKVDIYSPARAKQNPKVHENMFYELSLKSWEINLKRAKPIIHLYKSQPHATDGGAGGDESESHVFMAAFHEHILKAETRNEH